MKKLKTLTFVDTTENPLFTLCPGHVSLKTFNKAFKAEGWNEGDSEASDLSFIYCKKTKSGFLLQCSPELKGAKPYTKLGW